MIWTLAVTEALAAIAVRPDAHEALLVLILADDRGAPDVPTRLARVIEPQGLLAVVGRLLATGPEVTDRFCEALWYRFGSTSVLTAVAAKLAASEIGERSAIWQARADAIIGKESAGAI